MRKIHAFLLLFFFVSQLNVFAQADIPFKINVPGLNVPPLIITEVRMNTPTLSYIELTNVGEEAIDLHNFSLGCIDEWAIYSVFSETELNFVGKDLTISLAPTRAVGSVSLLPAGESLVLMQVYDGLRDDGIPAHKLAMLDKADYYFHVQERNTYEFFNKPEWQAFDTDSVNEGYTSWRSPIGFGITSGYFLTYRFINGDGNEDLACVDQFNLSIDPNYGVNGNQQGSYQTPIAGNPNALSQCVMVRKADVTQGNMNWHHSRGSNLDFGEWLPVPYTNSKFDVFTTVGNHGDFQLVYSAKAGRDIVIDDAKSIITLPWNVQRGDSVSHLFDLGLGMSWSYSLNGEGEDSALVNVQTGDKFTLYALGNKLKTKEFNIEVKDPTANLAVAYGSNVKVGRNWRSKYIVSNGNIVDGVEKDSITNIPYALRADSLIKYLYMPEGATWEFIFSDGTERIDLKHEDILRVTSADGTKTKDYIISVDEYVTNNKADLSLISWPDVNTVTYWEFLERGDTLPEFTPSKQNYLIVLKAGTKNIPALQFKASNTNATYRVKHATNLNGSSEERTTRVYVTATDGKTIKEYFVRFALEDEIKQPNRAEPFLAEFVIGYAFNGMALEIYNPGTEDLDLKGYMIVRGKSSETPQTSIAYLNSNAALKHSYISHYAPGFKWKTDDGASEDPWAADENGKRGFLVSDGGTVNTVVKPQDVFVMGSGTTIGRFASSSHFLSEYDMILNGKYEGSEDDLNPWGTILHKNNTVTYLNISASASNSSLYLLKILNDSITRGLKEVTDIADYRIIDRFQRSPASNDFWIGGRLLSTPATNGWKITRKPHVYKGVTGQAQGFGDNEGMSAENSEWIVFNNRDSQTAPDIAENIGSHIMNPSAKHYSTITSNRYKVSKGYEGNLTIIGSVNGVSVSDMENLLVREDEEQIFEFMDGTTALASDGIIQENMIIKVTSPNLINSSIYTFVQSPLDNNNLLVANTGSNLTVTKNILEGKIAGIEMGATLRSVLDRLTVPANAVLNVIDSNGNLASIKAMSYDSLLIDRIANPSLILEVVAENGDRANYELNFGHTAADAVLFSDLITIDQDKKILINAPENIDAPSLLKMIAANKGATLSIVDKASFVRTTGYLQIDDKILVKSEDGSKAVLYSIVFIDRIDYIGLNNAIFDFSELYEEATNGSKQGQYTTAMLKMGFDAIEAAKAALTAAENQDDVTAAINTVLSAMDKFIPTSINEFDNAEKINIFPNPASDVIFIDNLKGESTIIISNIVGQQLKVTTTNNSKVAVAIGNLSNGIYLVTLVKNGNSIKTEMIVKQ